MDDAGYALRVNEAGGVTLAAQAAGAKASLASRGAVNDGQWHHVIAEADRKARTFTIYIDGRQDAGGPGLGADGSLGNDANLYVGGTPQGHSLNGAIDFLRLARGTLVDSKTTIEELYAWEFRGPFLYDFIGHERPADGGEAGAIDEDTLGQGRTATYVVDQAAPGAADTDPGTEAKPFKTVQHAADVAKPGDTVYVMAGKYDERVKVKAGGTEGKLIAFVARPRRSAAVGGFDLEASYIRVEGFEITADKPATAVQLHASHCEIVDNYIHDMMAAVSGTVGKPSADGNTRDYSAVAHNRIAYNKVYHCEYGFILGGEDWLVENNEVSRLFMYASGNKNDDCDYSRFFGKGCIQRYNYYHGSTRPEIKTAHVDCLQTFTNNGEIAMDLLFEHNTCFDFHQMCMVESAPHIGSVRGWTFRHNIISANSPTMRGGWGPDIIQTLDVTIEHCTISTVNWAAIGLRGKESTGGLIRNNILCEAERAVDDRMDFSPANPVMEYNLMFKTAPLVGGTNINGKDPLFLDARKRDFRLRQGSPAIGMGKSGVTIGALEYPNVYYVDPRHPGACDDPAWGYPAVPLASLTKACAIAQPGETISLRGGVYREVLAPKNDGVIIRAMQGETVTISGADPIEGWRREVDGSWSAPLATEPKKVLRDSQQWSEFRYDRAAQRITMKTGGDPRLHVFETVVREQCLDLTGRKDTKVEGITVVDTLKPGLEPLSTAEASSTYSTTFDGDEDPLSESGKWINNGLDWTRIRKHGGIACGTQTGTNQGARRYDDSYAHLSWFPPDQEAWAQVHITKPDPSCHQELEILLRWSSSAHNTTGYECFARCVNDDSSYLQVVRWEGPLGKFTYLADNRGANYGLKNGDTLKASIVGNVITVYINGVEKARVEDDTYTTGNPGIGAFLSCDGGRGIGSNTEFGFRSFTARGIWQNAGTNPRLVRSQTR